ncbi:MAG: hypothetical protein KAR37_07150 [Alphaproteobacteria bacterium]|nr:hypothetical protein [Alphaproteobacteria bacterium]
MPAILTVVTGLLLLSAFPGTAHAYIDPGTAGMVLQAIIGGIVGALFVVRLYWQKLKRMVLPSSGAEEPDVTKREDD